MTLHNIKISTRLIGLSAVLLLGSILLGITGWLALASTNALLERTLAQAALVEDALDTTRKAQVTFKIQVQEWKNILLRGHDAAGYDKYRAAFLENASESQAKLAQLQGLLEQLELDTAMVRDARSAMAGLERKYLEALEHFEVARPETTAVVDAIVKGIDREPTKKLDHIVAYVSERSALVRQQHQAAAQAQYEQAMLTIWLTLASLLALGAGLTYWIISSVTRPLNSAIEIARTVAAGDLSARIEANSTDEVGQLLAALKDMNEGLVGIVTQVREATEAISIGASEIAVGNLDLSSRTEEQASALEETAASMEEITSVVRQNADYAQQARQTIASAAETALRGDHVVSDVIATMGSINEASKKVADIIGVIDSIAFQTNILALNAAVEAARAGEQGRGFAVVAAEVRGLAQRSATAAKEIKALIGNSVERVSAGEVLVAQAGATMHEVMEGVQRITGIMSDISGASHEQSNGLAQINTAMMQMDQVTQQNAALVEQAAAAAASLQHQAKQLTQTVGRFRLQAGAGEPVELRTVMREVRPRVVHAEPGRRMLAT